MLQSIMPSLVDEAEAAALFRELQFLAEYKYNKYEMYHPARLFLENLSLWLSQFDESERSAAIEFVQKELIFVSRQEFQQLAGVLYHDRIVRNQIALAGVLGGYPPHQVRKIRESEQFKRVTRASLYVGMSDGARIDYIRRHNLEISNEQVLPYYEVSESKVSDLLRSLRKDLRDESAGFACMFLVDDFCGSGRTVLREVAEAPLGDVSPLPTISTMWNGKLRIDETSMALEFLYEGEISVPEPLKKEILGLGTSSVYSSALAALQEAIEKRETTLKGALAKVDKGILASVLDHGASVFFCPLLTTSHAVDRLEALMPRLTGALSRTKMMPAAVLDASIEITSAGTPIGKLCERYYDEEFSDQHTGNVKYGFDRCGLPVVLHHNTPNNSLYLLWARKKEFPPSFRSIREARALRIEECPESVMPSRSELLMRQ